MGRPKGALEALTAAGKKSKLNPEDDAELLLKRQVQALEIIALILSEAMDFLDAYASNFGVIKDSRPGKSTGLN